MDDKAILDQVRSLVAEEHELRESSAAGEIAPEEEQRRLRTLEEALDQCWDLLRQRRARQEAGQNPDDVRARPVSEVEGYQQ